MSTKGKVFLGARRLPRDLRSCCFSSSATRARTTHFQPQNEFKLDPWIEINIGGIDFSINKAVFYLLLAAVLTIGGDDLVANRMKREPNKTQMAVELAYDLTRNNITGGNIPDERLAGSGSRSSPASSSSSGSRT